MARTMIVKLTNVNQSNAEGAVLKNNNQWTSPATGWLPVQAGVYDQLADGVHLHNPTKTIRVAVLQGLNFATSAKNDSGRALYPSLGEAGAWNVVDIVEV